MVMKRRLPYLREFAFIGDIAKTVKTGPAVIKGIGDDCAVLTYKKGKRLLLTTDMIIEGIHFDCKKVSPFSIGRKALAVNISDIAACGGIPKWAVVSIGMPRYTDSSYAYEVFKGINRLARTFGIDLVGGDTNCSKKLVLSITLLGEALKTELVFRRGARQADVLVITGSLDGRPDHLGFMPRLKESRFIVKELMPTAMIDISDGLLSDLGHILEESQKGALLYESLIPVDGKGLPITRVINTGEQFELLFTMPKGMMHLIPRGFHVIGEISGDTPIITFVRRSGQRKILSPKGYTHF
jgi:thiamine-monophosphate kinase